MRMRWGVVGAAVCALLLLALGGHVYVTAYGTGDPHAERAAAFKAAREVQAATKGTLWVATFTPNAGAHQQSNTGRGCFGRTVLVRLVWKDANFSNTGATGPPKAQLVTADATSGTVCFLSASYGPAAWPGPGEIYLYGPRKDLIPR